MICASVEAAAGTLQRSENFDQSEELYCIRFLLFFIVLHFLCSSLWILSSAMSRVYFGAIVTVITSAGKLSYNVSYPK